MITILELGRNVQFVRVIRVPLNIFSSQGARRVKAQGIGVHTAEEVMQFGCDDLKGLSNMLADKPFFFGDEPTTVSYLSFVFYSLHSFYN